MRPEQKEGETPRRPGRLQGSRGTLHTIHRGRIARNARPLFTGLNAKCHVVNLLDPRTTRCWEARSAGPLFTGLNAEWHVVNLLDPRTTRCWEARSAS
jgi:hypothetical protein